MRSDGCISYYVVQHLQSEVIAKQGASTHLWQRYGVHGYVDRPEADDALRVCVAKGGREFRLVRRVASRAEEVVALGHAAAVQAILDRERGT